MSKTMGTVALFLIVFLAFSIFSMIVARKAEGAVKSEGVSLLNVDDLHTLGILGSGITVGVISDGANSLVAAQAVGDLPGVFTTGSCTLPTSCNEGTAMLEIVHDVAPAAGLAFCAGMASTGDFLQCLTDLTAHGVDIIVDDVLFYEEPYFSDGPAAQAVASLVSSGIIYIASAGNDGESHYEALKAGGGFEHDFGEAAGAGVDPFMEIRVGSGEENDLTVYLQWNDEWGNSIANFNMRLWDASMSAEIASALGDQTGADPLEILTWTNSSGQAVTVNLLVEGLGGDVSTFEMFLKGDGFLQAQYVDVNGDGGVVGHAAVPGIITVGAVDAATPTTIEQFSSQGPSRIGTLTMITRPKPDLVAADNVLVSGVGGFGTPFSGTSAAAPHVAGIAALLLSAEPSTTVSEIGNALIGSAVDLGDPGFDSVYGYGRVDALAAFNRLTSGRGGGGCFIATAAYGSMEHPAVNILRRFRDEVLMKFGTGRAFIRLYYRHSPHAARWMEDSRWAGAVVGILLFPVILMAWATLNPGMLLMLLILASVYVTVAGQRRACRKKYWT